MFDDCNGNNFESSSVSTSSNQSQTNDTPVVVADTGQFLVVEADVCDNQSHHITAY